MLFLSFFYLPCCRSVVLLGLMAVTPNSRESLRPHPNGFTLVELLVVVTILGLLVGLGVPAISSGLGKARDGACLANLRQLGTALLTYPADNNGFLPRGNNNNGVEWPKAIYEYIPTLNAKLTGKQVNKAFLCPAEKQPTDQTNSCWQFTSSFALELGNSATKDTGVDGNGPRNLASIENPSKTILLIDGMIGNSSTPFQTESSTTWNALKNDLSKSSPGEIKLPDGKVSFRHAGKSGINALYADGHVATLKWSDRNNTNVFSEPIWRGRGF